MRVLWISSLTKLLLFSQTIVERMLYFAGIGFVMVAIILLGGCVVFYYTHLLPFHSPGSIMLVFHLLISFWLLSNILFNYLSCILTKPGFTDQSHLEALGGEKRKVCKACKIPKPERTHHCRICNRCVLKMDHHCPWMHNCVGHYNHRYFVLFLVYMSIGCTYYSLMAVQPFIKSMGYSTERWNREHPDMPKAPLTFAFVLAASIGVSVFLMCTWQMFLVLTAQTTIEFYENKLLNDEMRQKGEVFSNEYDLGTKENFRHFFNIGKYKWWTILLPISVPPVGDGSTQTTVRDFYSSKKTRSVVV